MAVAAVASVIFSFVLTLSTIYLWKETRRLATGAEGQAEDMKKSIAEASRAATAMEGVAAELGKSAAVAADSVRALKAQMRAYVTVQVGSATYQERDKNFYFGANPVFLNAGHTPAHNLRYRASADVISDASAKNFKYPEPPEEFGGATLNPQQFFNAKAFMDRFVPDQDVPEIRAMQGQSLVIWGTLTYDDVFGDSHSTKFGIMYEWLANGSIFGHWTKGHNEAD